MEVRIETINGKLCTVIRTPFSEVVEKVRESLAMGVPVVAELDGKRAWVIIRETKHESRERFQYSEYGGCTWNADKSNFSYAVTILPALPRHPKPEDAALLYQYASEGLFAVFSIDGTLTPLATPFVDEPFVGISQREAAKNYTLITTTCRAIWLLGNAPSDSPITHCVDTHGNRVDVAIEGAV